MVFESESYKIKNLEKGSTIFLDQKLCIDELDSTRPVSQDVITIFHTLSTQYNLVLVEEKSREKATYTPLHSLLKESGIPFFSTSEEVNQAHASLKNQHTSSSVVSHFCREHGITDDKKYYIHDSHKVSIFNEKIDSDTETFLPKVLTISFHNHHDMVTWLLSYENHYNLIREKILVGGEIIRNGGLVAFPTETVYGIGADATNPEAVQGIFKAKKRPLYDPLIIHVSDIEQMKELVTAIPEKAKELMNHFWPGPLTIVLPKSSLVPSIVTAGNPSVALRMPSNPIALELIRLSGKPIAAPSANLFGYTSPTTAQHVEQQLNGSYGEIIDGGACLVGIESTVISFLAETPKILRPGGIDQSAIELCIGKVISDQYESLDELSTSPGMLPSHYATSTPLKIVENINDFALESNVGALVFGKSEQVFLGPVEYLSLSSNPSEAANRLYQAMRRLDGLSLSLLVVQLLPETGIGIAINNRLKKAAINY